MLKLVSTEIIVPKPVVLKVLVLRTFELLKIVLLGRLAGTYRQSVLRRNEEERAKCDGPHRLHWLEPRLQAIRFEFTGIVRLLVHIDLA